MIVVNVINILFVTGDVRFLILTSVEKGKRDERDLVG